MRVCTSSHFGNFIITMIVASSVVLATEVTFGVRPGWLDWVVDCAGGTVGSFGRPTLHAGPLSFSYTNATAISTSATATATATAITQDVRADPDVTNVARLVLDIFFTAVFTCEAIVKMTAFRG